MGTIQREAEYEESRGQCFGAPEVKRAEVIDAGRLLVLDLCRGELNRYDLGMFIRQLQSLRGAKNGRGRCTPTWCRAVV